jgi:5-methylcytosine-specific restriction endonuclease McrA
MIDQVVQPRGEVSDLTAAEVLTAISERREVENRAAADQLALAASWADLHPTDSIGAVFSMPGSEHEESIAGDGCPAVAEFCLAELGAVLGISTTAATRLVGHALELRHRLPRLWALVQAGTVPAWRARSVAEVTIHHSPRLSREAVGWVDRHVVAVAGKVGPAQLDRLVAEAIKRFELAEADPTADPEDGYLHVDPRHATIQTDEVHFAGTVHLDADLDLADALDLDRALAHGAAELKALGSEESLDVRRSIALGELARAQTALDLDRQESTRTSVGGGGLPAARELVLHAHFDATAVDGGVRPVLAPTGRLEEGQRLILLEQVRSWCGDSHTSVVVRPVIDLNARTSTPAYEVPDRMREQVVLRDRTCVFPWCTRSARGCDLDHVVEFDHGADSEGRAQPGPTATWNLAPLCRRHHRLKTFTAWTYRVVGPGAFHWTSPHGRRYRRDQTGTSSLDPPHRS